jgi:chemotaxis protein MotB
MRLNSVTLLLIGTAFYSTGCLVPKKQLEACQSELSRLQVDSASMSMKIDDMTRTAARMKGDINQLTGTKTSLEQQIDKLKTDLDLAKKNANSLLSNSQQTIEEQQRKLAQLQALMNQQKENTEKLRKKIADALTNFNSDQLTVNIKNGKVYVSLQESLLFASGKADVAEKGVEALGKLANVLNQNNDINVLIEGHTDSIPIRGKYEDNWALSVSRATSIVRILTDQYKVDPFRVTASGRSQFEPIADNANSEGRAKNRRTEIILVPKLDELMKLLQN